MSVLESLPACPVWRIERALPDLQHHAMEGDASGAELSLVTDDRRGDGTWSDRTRRGVASLRADEDVPVVEWSDTASGSIAAFSRALRRLGWKGAPTMSTIVYGRAS